MAPAALFCIFLCWCFILERTKSARGSSRLEHKGPLVLLCSSARYMIILMKSTKTNVRFWVGFFVCWFFVASDWNMLSFVQFSSTRSLIGTWELIWDSACKCLSLHTLISVIINLSASETVKRAMGSGKAATEFDSWWWWVDLRYKIKVEWGHYFPPHTQTHTNLHKCSVAM